MKQFLIDAKNITLSMWISLFGVVLGAIGFVLEWTGRHLKSTGIKIVEYTFRFDL